MPVRFAQNDVVYGNEPAGFDSGTGPNRARVAPGRRYLELIGLPVLAFGIFTALGLLSFERDPVDPSVSGANWVGPVGDSICGWLIQGFGVVAWLVPLELAAVGWSLLRSRELRGLGFRLASDLILGILLSAAVQVLFLDATAFGAMRASGNVGWLFGELGRGLFSGLGTILVVATIAALLLTTRSRRSFIEVCELSLGFLNRVWLFLLGSLRRGYAAWSQAHALRKAKLPHIDQKPSDEAIIAELSDDDADCDDSWTEGSVPLVLSERLRVSRAPTTDALLDTVTPAAVIPKTVAKKSAKTSDEDAEDGVEVDEDDAIDDEAIESEEEDEEPEPELEVMPARSIPNVAKKREKAPEEPRIVDTRPAQQVTKPLRASARRKGNFQLPSTELLAVAEDTGIKLDEKRILEHARRLEKTLADYGVTAKVEEIHPGPTVTTYEVSAQAGTKVSKVASLADDLALGLSRKVRIIAPIPGKSRIGFELPNDHRIPVNLRELVEDERFVALSDRAALPVVLGRDIVGAPFYADLASFPHVILAGATGAGKSVGLNVMLASLLFRRTPDELRLLMIDPKVVELAPFDGIPHLLLPVVTDMKQATVALRWAVDEMERRYQLFATAGTKNITTYNRWVERVISGAVPPPAQAEVDALTADGQVVSVKSAQEGEDGRSLPGKLPYIVVVIDEFADLIMQQGKEVEAAVARLAQKARAAGLHVVLATQRPSVDVITGMIKANFPSRIAYLVAQKVDSRTILDEQGAEMLLGKGDMLVKLNGSNEVRRVQCPFISEDEVAALTDALRAQGAPQYHEAILQAADDEDSSEGEKEKLDSRFDEAVRIVADTQRCSTSWLQRKMTIGYNRAAKIVECMENRGIVGPPNGAKDRQVLISPL
jgi:DNA segregation ATPase FtsK/SpoIIIE, S-DNA-T family